MILVVVLLFTPVLTSHANTFYYDVYNHWAESDIYTATNSLRIFNGYGDYTFRPDQSISIAEYLKVLYKIGNENKMVSLNTRGSLNYTDISINHWAYTYILSFNHYMVSNPSIDYTIYDVFPGDKLNPSSPISRYQAALLTATLNLPSITDESLTFTDISTNNPYYDELNLLYNNGIIIGYNNNQFRPNTNLSRAEAAVLTKRIYQEASYSKAQLPKSVRYLRKEKSDGFPFFHQYDNRNLTSNDFNFIKAITTLEYLEFGGYIFPGDEPLYDKTPLETLKTLKEENYFNRFGLNYYLIKYSNLSDQEKLNLSEELFNVLQEENNLTIDEKTLLLTEMIKYNVNSEIVDYMTSIKYTTVDAYQQANLDFLIIDYFINTDRLAEFYAWAIEYRELSLNVSSFINGNQLESRIQTSTITRAIDQFEILNHYLLNLTYGLIEVGFTVEAQEWLVDYYNRLSQHTSYGNLDSSHYHQLIGTIKTLKLKN